MAFPSSVLDTGSRVPPCSVETAMRRLRRSVPVPLAALAAACDGARVREPVQSALDPIGPDAARIAELSWILFIGAGIIFLITFVLALIASVSTGRWARFMATRRFILAGGVAFPVVVLTALLFYGFGLTHALSGPFRPAEPPLRIEMVGWQFWWAVRYPGAAPDGGDVVTANEIHIPVGREVEIAITSADVIHSVWIPTLDGKLDMIPGRVNTLSFRASRPAVVRGQCAEFCGAQHALMAFYVVAQPPEAFEEWLAHQAQPVTPPPPANDFLARGMRVFGAAGCGACHAVRGTEWNGRLGPDLTHVGSRLSIAAGTLDNHLGTLAGWIAAPQDIKPGNNMPSYHAVLDGEELRAVAAWLESLK